MGARVWATWLQLMLYIIGNIVADLLIVIAHRYFHPVAGERLLGTFSRLSTKARAHWPAHQDTDEVIADDQVWKQTSLADRLPFCSDELLTVMFMYANALSLFSSGVSMAFSRCYIYQ